MSQEELADAAGVNRTYISKLETGVTFVGLEILERLAAALDAQPTDLLKPQLRAPKRKG